jgi:uncharacterized RDD family membrane protein YckC
VNAIAQVSAATLTGPKLDNRRVLAGIVDLLIVTAGALLVLYAGDSLTSDRQGALSAVILGWALYYYFALESGGGQTVGKKLMKLRVVRADGRPAGMREIAVRTILRVVDGVGLYIVGLIVMLATGQRRQRIGDLAAGTIVVDASGPATAVAEPAVPDAVADEADAEDMHDDDAGDDPVAAAQPTKTITLPSRPQRPETLDDLTEPPAEPAAEEAAEGTDTEPTAEAEPVVEMEPVVEVEPIADEPVAEQEPVVEMEHVADPEPVAQSEPVPVVPVADADPVVEVEPAAEHEPSGEVESFEMKPFEVEPYDMDKLESDEDEPEAEEPVADAGLPPVASPSIQGLAADVAAARDTGEEASESDEPVNVKSVETVSAMDLIMGAAEEDSAKPDEDEPPASA